LAKWLKYEPNLPITGGVGFGLSTRHLRLRPGVRLESFFSCDDVGPMVFGDRKNIFGAI
jgi:hypothetical protein